MLYTKSLKMLFPVHFTFWHVILCRWDVSWCLLSIGKGKGWWYFTSAASRTAVIFIPFLIVSGSLSHNPVEFSFCLVDHPQCLLLWVCCLWFRLMNLLESTEAMHGGLIISKMVFDLFLPNSSVGDFFSFHLVESCYPISVQIYSVCSSDLWQCRQVFVG